MLQTELSRKEENYFTARSWSSLFLKRMSRIRNFRRVPIASGIRILFSYCKKFFGVPLSEEEKDLNYYFLTLINCDCTSMSIEPDYYYFQSADKIKFTARRHSSSDLEVFNQVWGRKEYTKATNILKNTTGNGSKMTIIDAGANAGYTSLFFYHDFPNSVIYSIEPDEGNYSVIKKNIEINSAERIVPLKFGLWDRTCNLMIDRTYRDGKEWSIQVVETSDDSELKGISVKDLMQAHHIDEIDLFKIDIEGAESYLFKDTDAANFFLSKTKVLAIEIHDENISRDFVRELLTENNFTYFDFNDITIAYRK